MNERLELRMYGLVPYNISPIQQAIQYGHAVQEYNNSIYLPSDDGIINIVSFKNIKKDEEILVAYGFNYWLNRL